MRRTLTFIAIMLTTFSQANAEPLVAAGRSNVIVVPSKLPESANLSKKNFIRFKVFESTKPNVSPQTYLVVRFSCDPLRYSSWIVNEKSGVSGEITVVKFDDQAVLNISAFKQTQKVLVIEDTWGEGEHSVFDRLKSTKNVKIFYTDSTKIIRKASFVVSAISKSIVEAEGACFKE